MALVGSGPQLRTERLLLRRWRSSDLQPFAAINADPLVMEYLPAPLSGPETAALMARIERCFEARGYGLWAVEIPGEAALIGFVGLSPVDLELASAPVVELGWRLARAFWGRGLAAEAAAAAMRFGFQELELPALVAFTAAGNQRSRRLMQRLGMRRDPAEDFEHPLLPAGHPLRAHILHRVDADRWRISSPACAGATYAPS